MTTPQPAFDPTEDPKALIRCAVESVQNRRFEDAVTDFQHAAQACELAGDIQTATHMSLAKGQAQWLERECRAFLNRVAKEL